jgi:hypothetical protein
MLMNRDPREDGLTNYKKWKKEYKYELLDYNYVHKLEEFSIIAKGGLIRPFSIFSEKMLPGGIVIKIDKDTKNKWYALLGLFFKNEKPKYIKIYFDKNYIFYKPPDKLQIDENNTETMKCLMEKFVSKDEVNKYETSIKNFNLVDDLRKEYVKNKK